MMTARIVVLIVALGAGAGAAYIASGTDTAKPVVVQETAPPLATVDVLVAKTDIGLGQPARPSSKTSCVNSTGSNSCGRPKSARPC
jgi:pilus assembly protein CpaB